MPLDVDVPVLDPVLVLVPELVVDDVPVPEVDPEEEVDVPVDVPVVPPDDVLVPLPEVEAPDVEVVPPPELVELDAEFVSPPEDEAEVDPDASLEFPAGAGVELELGVLATDEELVAEFAAVCELPALDELPPQPTVALKTANKSEPAIFK